jgi:hypothetical protein
LSADKTSSSSPITPFGAVLFLRLNRVPRFGPVVVAPVAELMKLPPMASASAPCIAMASPLIQSQPSEIKERRQLVSKTSSG